MENEDANLGFRDILYFDKERLFPLLSQLDEKGVVVQQVDIKSSSEGVSVEKKRKFITGFLVNFFAAGWRSSGEISKTKKNNNEVTNGFQMYYNTEYNAASSFVDRMIISEHCSLIQDGIPGDIIISYGEISILDVEYLIDFYKGTTKNYFEFHDVSSQDDVKINLEIAKMAPKTINFSMKIDGEIEAWSTLKRSGMQIDYFDLLLKYGFNIPGQWGCLAILEAISEYENQGCEESNITGPLADIFNFSIPLVKQYYGRPGRSYAITPIVIFRELNAENN